MKFDKVVKMEKITNNVTHLRPCYANGVPALFHKWVDIAQVVPPSLMRGGHSGGEVRDTLALVEYADGTVEKVYVDKIQFCCSEFQTVAFIPADEMKRRCK